MEPEGLSPCLQLPTICPSPEPEESNLYPPISFLRSLLIFWCLCLGLPSGLFPSSFSHQDECVFLFSPIYDTCLTHFVFLNLIMRIMFGDQYRSRSSSLCSFFQFPFTPSLIGPQIFIITQLSVTILPVFFLNEQFVLCCCTVGWY